MWSFDVISAANADKNIPEIRPRLLIRCFGSDPLPKIDQSQWDKFLELQFHDIDIIQCTELIEMQRMVINKFRRHYEVSD